MNRLHLSGLLAVPVLMVAIAGCGQQHPAASAPVKTNHKQHHTTSASPSTVPSSSPSPSASSSPSVSVSTSTSVSSLPVQSNANPQPVLSNVPSAAGVGNPSGIRATVNSVQAEGTVTVNGSSDNLYLLNMTLRNITTSMIQFPLSDLIVAPSTTSATTSRNDYSLDGITKSDSLFPYPIVPDHASAVIVMVPSNQSVSGDFTVEVPSASHYSVRISGDSSAVATFSN